MHRVKKKANIVCNIFYRESGIGCRNRRVPPDSILLNCVEESASLPNKNLHCELNGQPRSTLVIAFSSDCSRIASTHGDHTVRITDATTGKCTHVLPGHSRTPWCIAFHPSSNDLLASGCLAGEVRIWDLKGGGSEVWRSPDGFSVASLTFHPSDNVLVFAIGNKLRFWSWKTPEPFMECRTSREYEKIRWVKFDPLGHTIYTGIANGSTITAPDDYFSRYHLPERNRSGFPDRSGRSSQAADEAPPPDGELSSLLNRNDYDLPGFVQSQDVWTLDLSRGSSDPNAGAASSWSEATSALVNARRYAARETSRHSAAADSTVSRAMAWDTVPQPRRSTVMHGWDNPSVSDVTRRRNRLFNNLLNGRIDVADPPDWATGRYTHPSYPHPAGSGGVVEDARSGAIRDYSPLLSAHDPLLNSHSHDGSRRTLDRRAESTAGPSGTVPTVVVSWENESIDVGPDNEAEEVTSTAAEAGSTASLGESIDADIETRSMLDADTSLSGSTDVAASGSLGHDSSRGLLFASAMMPELMTTEWNFVSGDAAAAATARRHGALQTQEDPENFTNRRWRRFSRRQAESEASMRRQRREQMCLEFSVAQRLEQEHSYASSNVTTAPIEYSDDLPFDQFLGDTFPPVDAGSRHSGFQNTSSSSVSSFISMVNSTNQSNVVMPSAVASSLQSLTDQGRRQTNESPINLSTSAFLAVEPRNSVNSHENQGASYPLNTAGVLSPTFVLESHSSRRPVMAESASTVIAMEFPPLSSDLITAMFQSPQQPPAPEIRPPVSSESSFAGSDLSSMNSDYLQQQLRDGAANDADEMDLSSHADSRIPYRRQDAVSAASGSTRPYPSYLNSYHSYQSRMRNDRAEDGYAQVGIVPHAVTNEQTTSASVGRSPSTSTGWSSRQTLPQNLLPPSSIAAGASSSSGMQPPVHSCRRNCDICGGPNVSRSLASLDRRGRLSSRLSQISYDRLRSSRTSVPQSSYFTNSTGERFPLHFWSPSRSRSPSVQPAVNHLPSWERIFSPGDNPISDFEQRMNQVDERVSRIRQQLAENRAFRQEHNHMDGDREVGVSSLRERLRERQERMRSHIDELRSRIGRATNRPGESSRSGTSRSLVDPLPSGGSRLTGFGSTGADTVGDFMSYNSEGLRAITHRSHFNASRINAARRVAAAANGLDYAPDAAVFDPTDNEERVQAAINQAIHGAFISNGGEPAVGNNVLDLTFRIQAWDSVDHQPPDLSDPTSNIVVRRAKLHNDATCDISADGTLLCTFIQTSRGGFASSPDVTLGIFSLVPESRGQCLHTKSFGPNAISISISPLNNFVLVGLASKRFSWIFTPKQIVAQVYRLNTSGCSEKSLEQVGDILHSCDMDFRAPVSMNSARWLPMPGDGLAYGTNRGDLHICRPGADQQDKPELDGTEMPGDEANPVRQSLMQMLGLSLPRTASTATQTGASTRRSASTQTEMHYAGAASSSGSSESTSRRGATRD